MPEGQWEGPGDGSSSIARLGDSSSSQLLQMCPEWHPRGLALHKHRNISRDKDGGRQPSSQLPGLSCSVLLGWCSRSCLLGWEQGAFLAPWAVKLASVGLSSPAQGHSGDALPAATTEGFQPFPSARPGWVWGFTLPLVSPGARLDAEKTLLLMCFRGKAGAKPCVPGRAGGGTAVGVQTVPWPSAPVGAAPRSPPAPLPSSPAPSPSPRACFPSPEPGPDGCGVARAWQVPLLVWSCCCSFFGFVL